jgi:hypothetical protein
MRIMFSLWRTKTRIKTAQQKIICESGASYAVEKIVVEKIETKEATAETRKETKVKIQKHTAKIPTLKSSAIIVPIVVATPFPPLNFKYIG